MDINNLTDCIRTQGKFTETFLPTGSAKFLDRNFSILPYLCELLKNANDSTIDPLLVKPEPFDVTPYTDVSGLTAIGDPRFSLGSVLSATYVNFLPRMIAQTELKQSGGTQVIDNYICDSDGVPIKESETIPILLSLDLTGQKPYNYGAVYIPPLSAGTTLDQLLEPIQPQEIEFFVLNNIKIAIESTAENFVNFIGLYFPDWTASLYEYTTPPVFMVQLNRVDPATANPETVFLKFHLDSIKPVANLLNLKTITYCQGAPQSQGPAQTKAIADIPLDYNDAMSSGQAGKATYDYIMANYHLTTQNSYATLFASPQSMQTYFDTINNTNASTVICAVSSL